MHLGRPVAGCQVIHFTKTAAKLHFIKIFSKFRFQNGTAPPSLSRVEAVPVPFQGLLVLLAFAPVADRDVLAAAGQVVRYVGAVVGAVFHGEAEVVVPQHLLRGVVVAEEGKAVELAGAVVPVAVAHHVVGDDLMFLVRFVPEAHLDAQQVFFVAGFEAHEAVALVDGQGLVLLLREAFAVADPGLPEGVGRFVVAAFFVVRLVGGAEEGPDEVADGGLLALIIYLDAVLRRENQRAAGKDDGQCDFFHIAVVMMTLRSRFVGVKIARFRHFSKKRCPARKGGYHLYINCYFWNINICRWSWFLLLHCNKCS